MSLSPDQPECSSCKHRLKCVLPQREENRACGWYNAGVHKLVRREQLDRSRVRPGGSASR